MQKLTFDKTDKGREEIATRAYHLAPRLRTLLLLLDGKNPVDQVLLKVAGLGVDEAGVSSLLEQGFIHQVGSAEAATADEAGAPTAAEIAPVAQSAQAPVEPTLAPSDAVIAPATSPAETAPSTPVAEPSPAQPATLDVAVTATDPSQASDLPAEPLEPVDLLPATTEPALAAQQPVAPTDVAVSDAAVQFASVYQFFNESIKKTIGMRGFALQLKVERAATLDDFRALRDVYIAQVKNVHGPEVARDIGERLDLLLKPQN